MCVHRLGGRRGSGSFSGVEELKMDFEDEVGVSGGQSQKWFQRKPKACAKALRHGRARVCGACMCSDVSLPVKGATSVAEEAGKVG